MWVWCFLFNNAIKAPVSIYRTVAEFTKYCTVCAAKGVYTGAESTKCVGNSFAFQLFEILLCQQQTKTITKTLKYCRLKKSQIESWFMMCNFSRVEIRKSRDFHPGIFVPRRLVNSDLVLHTLHTPNRKYKKSQVPLHLFHEQNCTHIVKCTGTHYRLKILKKKTFSMEYKLVWWISDTTDSQCQRSNGPGIDSTFFKAQYSMRVFALGGFQGIKSTLGPHFEAKV